jgi:hypothetical protein
MTNPTPLVTVPGPTPWPQTGALDGVNPPADYNPLKSNNTQIPDAAGNVAEFIATVVLQAITGLLGALFDGLCSIFGGVPITGTTQSSFLSGTQNGMDSVCNLFSGGGSTGTSGASMIAGAQGVIGTGSNLLTGDSGAINSGSGLMDGSISLLNTLCSLCTGGLGMPEQAAQRRMGRLSERARERMGLPPKVGTVTPLVSGASLVSGIQGWIATGSFHLAGDPTVLTNGHALANQAQTHLDTVTGIMGGMGTGNSMRSVLNLGTQYHADAKGLLGNPGGLGTGSPTIAVDAASIPILGPANIAHHDLIDKLFGAFTGISSTGHSPADVANAAANLAQTAQTAAQQAQVGQTYVDLMAVNSPGHHAVDPSLTATFDITSITGTTADTIPVNSTTSAIGYIHIGAAAVKSSIAWYGGGVTGLSAAFLNLFSVDPATGINTLVWSSGNIIASISTAVDWVYVSMPPVSVSQNSWYAVELAVVGSGTHTMVGLPNHWLNPNPTVFPKQLGATRNTTLPVVDTVSTYGSAALVTTDSWTQTLSALSTAMYVLLNASTTGAIPTATAKIGLTPMTLIETFQYDSTSIAFDAVGTGANASGASITWSHTAASGAYVIAAIEVAVGTPTSVTYGGVAMTLLKTQTANNNSSNGALWVYGLASPPTGVQSVIASLPAGNAASGNSVSYLGVASVGTIPTPVFGNGTSPSEGPITCPANGMIVQAFGNNGTSTGFSSPTGGTNRFIGTESSAKTSISDSSATTTFGITEGNLSSYAGIAIPLVPNAATRAGLIYVFELLTPPTGLQTISYTLSSSALVSGVGASYEGANGVGTIATNSGTGTAMTQSETATANQLVLQAFANDTGLGSITGYNQTAVAYEPGGTGHDPLFVGQAVATGSAQTFSATAGVSAPWGAVAIPLTAASYIAPNPVIGSLPSGAAAYSPNLPWLALSSENVTTQGTFAPVTIPYYVPGTYIFDIPFWASFIDLVGLGGGGDGANGTALGRGDGGSAGNWNGRVIERAVDFMDSPTATLTVVVGTGGINNGPGVATTISWTDTLGHTQTLTCAGGAAATQPTYLGQAAPIFIFDGAPYYGDITGTTFSFGGGGIGGKAFGGPSSGGGNGGVFLNMRSGAGAAREIPVSVGISGSGTLAAAAGRRGNLTGHGALSAAAFPHYVRTAALPGHGVISATAGRHGNLAGSGTLSATAFARYACPAALPGQGVLAAPIQVKLSAPLPGSGALSATAGRHANLAGHGIVSATAGRRGNLIGHGVLSAKIKVKLTGPLTGRGVLSAPIKVKLKALLSGHGALSAVTKPPVMFDAVGTGALSAGGSGSSSISWTHDAAADSYVIVGITSNGTVAITTMTYGGQPMSLLGSQETNNTSNESTIYFYGLANPPTGSQTVLAVFASPTASVGNSVSYLNVNSVGTVQTVFGTGTTTSQTVTCTSEQMIVQAFDAWAFGGSIAPSGGTNRSILERSFSRVAISDATVSTTFTAAINSSDWAGIAVVLT